MPCLTTDESVLKFIGFSGTSAAELAQHFPDFDVNRLIRAQLVAFAADRDAEAEAHRNAASGRVRYVLTRRGMQAAGLLALST